LERFLADTLFEFLTSCDMAENKDDLAGAVGDVSQRLGYDHSAMAFIPLAHERLDTYFIWDRWPDGWRGRYLELNYFHFDPVAKLVRQSDKPAVWSKLDGRFLEPKARRIMDEAGDFGLVDGVTIPLHSQAGLAGLFTIAGKRDPITPNEVRFFQIVAASAHMRLTEFGSSKHGLSSGIHITRSESECLTMCAAGKTDKEIGMITGRSQRTVQAHIGNLQRKLSAANRAQLIAEAFRRGLQR
jgi:LuxR family quorum sensing-dependent transcriptional regulator